MAWKDPTRSRQAMQGVPALLGPAGKHPELAWSYKVGRSHFALQGSLRLARSHEIIQALARSSNIRHGIH